MVPTLPTVLGLLWSSTVAAAAPIYLPTKLGAYDYFTDETTPVVFNGRAILVEAIVAASWQWAGHWLPYPFNSTDACASYFRVRDLATNAIIQNISASCNHAFASGYVVSDSEGGVDTLTIVGTAWNRMNDPPPLLRHRRLRSERLGWSGPCANGNCTVDAFVSQDPALQAWTATVPAAYPRVLVYNTDVAFVGGAPAETPAARAAARARAAAGLPPFRWVMILEGGDERARFAVSNGATATADYRDWVFLNGTLPQFGNGEIGSCPSIRFDANTGLFYVLTGGNAIVALRSPDLVSWTVADRVPGGVVIAPSQADCAVCTAPGFGGFAPNAEARDKMATKCSSPAGFGNDSDVDLVELVVNGTLSTLFQYGSGDQQTFGFSNYAVSPAPMFVTLASFFS
jgi:hypothetical protein